MTYRFFESAKVVWETLFGCRLFRGTLEDHHGTIDDTLTFSFELGSSSNYIQRMYL